MPVDATGKGEALLCSQRLSASSLLCSLERNHRSQVTAQALEGGLLVVGWVEDGACPAEQGCSARAGPCVLLTEAGSYLCGYAGMPSRFEPNSSWSRGQVPSHFQVSHEGSPRMQGQLAHTTRAICSDFRPPASGLGMLESANFAGSPAALFESLR
jgi:hypothetical protein